MSSRKSSRLASKGFKSKTIQETISIEDESTDTDEMLQTLKQDGNPREIRSKSQADSKNQDAAKEKGKAKLETQQHASSESDSESWSKPSSLEVQPSKKRKLTERSVRKEPSVKMRNVKSSKILECAYIDFNFFNENGFFWDFWLNRIGCKNICNIEGIFDGWLIQEFYENLEKLDDTVLKSRISGKKFKITRNDLIACFGMKDEEEDKMVIHMEKQVLYNELNDGVGKYSDKDIFSTDFDLLIRLLHKIVVDCILPKNGSTTTISMEEATVILGMKKNVSLDVPSMILRHLWRTRNNKPYGNLLIKFFKFKKIPLPRELTMPVNLKKIGETNLKRMGIQVYENFWFTKDGSWYRHAKFNKFCFDWKKIKALAEGELVSLAEGQTEGLGDKGKNRDDVSKAKGKEKMERKIKKKHQLRTGGKFEIKEGQKEDVKSDSETESESFPHTHYGESYFSSIRAAVEGHVNQKLDGIKKSLVDSIMLSLKDFQSVEKEQSIPSDLPHSHVDPPSPVHASSPTKEKSSPVKDAEQSGAEADPQDIVLSLVPVHQSEVQQSAPQLSEVEVISNVINFLQQQNLIPPSSQTSFRQRRKMKARKQGHPQFKKD